MRALPILRAVACGLILLLAAMPAAAFDFGGKGVKGSGKMETRELDLADIDALDLGGAFEVDVTFGDKQRVTVTIDDNLWDLLEAEVHGGEFELGWKKSVRPADDCRAELVLRSLDELHVSGAGEIRIRGFRGGDFEFGLSGAADLEMDGEADKLKVRVSGAGDIDARDLKAKHVDITISGAGNADVYASESVEAHVSGVGDIDVWGAPERQKTKTSGLGSIKIHD
jgi:hypothetical protein